MADFTQQTAIRRLHNTLTPVITSNHTSASPPKVTRILRFLDEQGQVRLGAPADSSSKNVTEAYVISGDILNIATARVDTSRRVKVKKLLPPVQPTNIIGIGLNYAKHAKESNMPEPKNPVVFMKNTSSVMGSGPGNTIVIPKVAQYQPQTDYEGELCVVIGRHCKNVSEDEALSYVLGYMIAHDVSCRDWQQNKDKGGGQWNFSKSFDTFCPTGPYLTLASEVKDPNKLQLQTYVNGQKMQDMTTADMIFNVRKLISFLSQGTTLTPGTIILTGTPEGVGQGRNPKLWLKHGDKVEINITGLGTLSNDVTEEK